MVEEEAHKATYAQGTESHFFFTPAGKATPAGALKDWRCWRRSPPGGRSQRLVMVPQAMVSVHLLEAV